MSALTAVRTVARVKGNASSSSPISVKLPADVVESARIVAAFRNVSMSDMLGEILRPILSKMEKDEIARRAKATKGGEN